MRRFALIVVLVALVALAIAAPFVAAQPTGQTWLTDYAAAASESAATGKPLLIFCTQTGCRHCLTMAHIFNGEPAALSRCVLLRLKDETTYTPQLGVTRFPSLLLYGADGGYLWSHVGAMPGIELRERMDAVPPQIIGQDAAALANGVDMTKWHPADGGVAYKHSSGRQLSREEAHAMIAAPTTIPDDAGKFRLTVIGTPDQRAAVTRDWLAAGDLGDTRDRTAVWSVRPDHPLVARFGFVTSGAPTIYFQSPPDADNHAAAVLHRQGGYTGPADFQAIRKAVADYDAKRDPDRRKADALTLPALSQFAFPVLALCTVLGAGFFLVRKG